MTSVTPPLSQLEAARPIRISLFGRTDVGQIREHNEDNFLVANLTRRTRSLLEPDRRFAIGPRGAVLGVCDGMGGAAAGEVASQLAVDIIYEHMVSAEAPQHHDELARRLVRAVEAAGLRIFTEAKVDRARRGMGTTATIAALVDDHLFLAQVGDSRGYILRGDRFVQVTRDQSLVNQLIEAGQLTEAEAETFEHNNIILQALGTADTVQVDLTFVELRRGDTLLICSDGLSGMVRLDEIREVLLSIREPLDACKVLTDKANEAGGHDNITVIVAKFEGEGLELPAGNDDLRYRKYPFSQERPSGGLLSAPPELHANPSYHAMTSGRAAGADRVSDHGPSRSKVSNTIIGGDEISQAALEALANPQDASHYGTRFAPHANMAWREPVAGPSPLGDDPDSYTIPTNAPAWMVGSVVVTALALALLLGYYLLR